MTVVRDTTGVRVGDRIAYPAQSHDERDELLVTRIERRMIFGKRVHPQEWEREIEFAIYPTQVGAGVRLLAGPGSEGE